MIFVTVGTQLPFDRLIRAMDEWAGSQGESGVFAQIGPSQFRPRHIGCSQFVSDQEFLERIRQASLVVAHAGMGSILRALEMGKPIIVMPRLASLGEHRNDHQLATVKRLKGQARLEVAVDEGELLERLGKVNHLSGFEPISQAATPRLLRAVRSFIHEQPLPVMAGLGQELSGAAISRGT